MHIFRHFHKQLDTSTSHKTDCSEKEVTQSVASRRTLLRSGPTLLLAAGTVMMNEIVTSSPIHAQSKNTEQKQEIDSSARTLLAQDQWRACRKCQGLFYAGFGGGVCPAGGGHNATGSFDYTLSSDGIPL